MLKLSLVGPTDSQSASTLYILKSGFSMRMVFCVFCILSDHIILNEISSLFSHVVHTFLRPKDSSCLAKLISKKKRRRKGRRRRKRRKRNRRKRNKRKRNRRKRRAI